MRGHVRNHQLKTGEKRWAAVVYRGKRVAKNGMLRDACRWIRGFHTQRAAQNELNKLLRSLDDGTYAEASKQTVAEFLDRWLTTVKPNLEAKTFERYKEIVDININPKLGAIQLTKLQPQQISEFYAWSATSGNRRNNTGLSPRTVLHIHRLLRKALQQSVIWQVRPTNPAAMIEAPRAKDKEMKPVEEDRAGWLIEAAENTELYLLILIALYTGMRRGEILGLRWSDLDLDNARLTVKQALGQTRAGIHFKKPKNKKSNRTIALSETLIAAIKEHHERQEKTKALFGTDYPKHDLVIPLADGTPWPPDRFTDEYIAFTRRVTAREIRFHDLRHTHASELLRRGIPLKTVSQRLGHAKPHGDAGYLRARHERRRRKSRQNHGRHLLRLLPMRLFTRLTNAFSKKRARQTLRVTPAMAAGVTDRGWEVIDIVKLLDELPRSRTLGILTTEKRLGIIRANHQGVL